MQLNDFSPRDHHGFTLVEMAIVLLIIGLLLGSLLMPLSARVDQQRYQDTEQMLVEVREALLGFAIANKRLPCPASNPATGVEDCAVTSEGYLPWAALGTGRSDAWNHPLRYRADSALRTTIPDPPNTTDGLYVQDLASPPVRLTSNDATNGPAVILFSCGKDGVPNAENDGTGANAPVCDNPGTLNLIYTQDAPSNTYDDILIWLSKNTLLNRLVAAGRWP